MLLNQGLELLLYGMGTVVLFLGLLVFATRAMSATVLRFFPEPEAALSAQAIAAAHTSPSNTAPGHQSGEIAADESLRLAAVAAAVRAHRRRRAC
ncbi:MAG: hypothetical protein Cons2KO_05530 [Congregibacter sp.]